MHPRIGFFFGGRPNPGPLGFEFGGRPDPDVLREFGRYDWGAQGQGKIPNLVNDSFLQRKSGIFGFPLLQEGEQLGLGYLRTLQNKVAE